MRVSRVTAAALLLAAARAASAADFVPAQYDLSALPAYQPEQMALGVVRIYGTPLETLVGQWASAFRAKQGHVRLDAYLINTSQAFAGLLTGKADIGLMGHRTWHTSVMAFDKAFGYEPLEIRFATGSYDDPQGSTPGLMFVVHKTNPLSRLTLEQIDGIFCAQRTGAWDGAKWSPAAARGAARRHRPQGPRQDARPGDHRGRAERSARDRLHVPARHQQGEVRREGAAARAHGRRALCDAERADLLRRQLPDAQRRVPVPQPQAGRGHSHARQGVRALRALPRGPENRRRQPHLHPAQRRAGEGGTEEARLMKNIIAAILLLCAMPSIAADALPGYAPDAKLSGTIRLSGNDQMAALLSRWERGFRKFHPDVRFDEWLKGSGSGMYSLEKRTGH